MVQIFAIQCNIECFCISTHLVFTILKMKCAYFLQQNSPTGFKIETSMLSEHLGRVDEFQP
jgi:hypothetical protein